MRLAYGLALEVPSRVLQKEGSAQRMLSSRSRKRKPVVHGDSKDKEVKSVRERDTIASILSSTADQQLRSREALEAEIVRPSDASVLVPRGEQAGTSVSSPPLVDDDMEGNENNIVFSGSTLGNLPLGSTGPTTSLGGSAPPADRCL